MQNEIVNRVASSKLLTLDLEQWYQPGERHLIDIKSQLYQELILKEKDFREYVSATDWSFYKDGFVAITCSVDAIIPTWAFMLLAIALQPYAKRVVFGDIEELEKKLFKEAIEQIDWSSFKDAKVVVKGCSKINVPVEIYVEAAARLRAVAQSIMFGEPCSTVPLFKKGKS